MPRRRMTTGYSLGTYRLRFEELGTEAWVFMERGELTRKEADDLAQLVVKCQDVIYRARKRRGET
jgi:hypothetical protein